MYRHGPLTRYVKLRVAHAPGMPGTFCPPRRVSDPDMHHGTCVTHVPWCMPGSLTSGFLWSRWREKRSRHSRRMRNRNFPYLARGPWRHQPTMCYLDYPNDRIWFIATMATDVTCHMIVMFDYCVHSMMVEILFPPHFPWSPFRAEEDEAGVLPEMATTRCYLTN